MSYLTRSYTDSVDYERFFADRFIYNATFTATTLPAANSWTDLIMSDVNTYCFVCSSNGTNRIYSWQGSSWSAAAGIPANSWRKFASNGSTVILCVSSDGTNNRIARYVSSWTSITTPSNANATFNCIAYGNGKFVASGTGGTHQIMYSTDNGTTWNSYAWPLGTSAFAPVHLVHDGQRFIGLNNNGTAYTSIDGINWIASGFTMGPPSSPLYAGGGLSMVADFDNSPYGLTIDGINWFQPTNRPFLNSTGFGCYYKISNSRGFFIYPDQGSPKLYSPFTRKIYGGASSQTGLQQIFVTAGFNTMMTITPNSATAYWCSKIV